MIRYVTGNLLDDDAELLVNTVNCVGVMGKGLALQFARRYPQILSRYREACRTRELRPGAILRHPLASGRVIVSFPTKDDWRNPSRIEWIDTGLATLARSIQRHGHTSAAIPPLGCGLGGLRWADVRPLIERHMGDLACDVRVYAPR